LQWANSSIVELHFEVLMDLFGSHSVYRKNFFIPCVTLAAFAFEGKTKLTFLLCGDSSVSSQVKECNSRPGDAFSPNVFTQHFHPTFSPNIFTQHFHPTFSLKRFLNWTMLLSVVGGLILNYITQITVRRPAAGFSLLGKLYFIPSS
jgi:hypothetical protein